MLVLSRKVEESIVLDVNGECIVLTIFSINDHRVRLGVDAPKHIPVMRSELLEQNDEPH